MLIFGIADKWMTRELVFAALVATLAMSGPVIMISVFTNLPSEALYSVLLWPALASIVPMILYHTLPVLAAVAVVWCYGKYASNGTLVALYVAGRSHLSVRTPGLAVAAGAAILGYLLSSYIAPHTARHLHDVLYSIRYNLAPSLLQVGKFNQFGRKGDVVFAERRIGHNQFANVFILRREVEGEERAYAARHAMFEQRGDEQVVILIDGSIQVFPSEQKETKTVAFESMALPMAKAASAERVYRTVDELDTTDFLKQRERGPADPATARSWLREALNRFVIPGLAMSHTLLGLELLAATGVLTDRRRDRIALICAGISLIHFGTVFAIEQVGGNVQWLWGVVAIIAAELAAAASLALLRSGMVARYAGG